MSVVRYNRDDVVRALSDGRLDVVVSDAPVSIDTEYVTWACSFKVPKWKSTSSASDAECTRDAARESLRWFERAMRLPPRCFEQIKIKVKGGASVSFLFRIPREHTRGC